MAARSEARLLPYGIGNFSLGWILAVVVLLILAVLGVYAYGVQLSQGLVSTGLRDTGSMGGAPWGLYIAFELYLVGAGFGALVIIALIRLSRLPHLQPLVRPASLLALAALIAGSLSVIADLGQPLRGLINLARYARPMSPLFGTFTIGTVTSLLLVIVYLYLDGRRDAALLAQRPTAWRGFLRFVAAGYHDSPGERQRHAQTSFALVLLLLLWGLVSASTSGFVFGIQVGRPGWYTALQAPGSVVLALAVATGLLTVIAAILRPVVDAARQLDHRVFVWLNNFLLLVTLVYVYFMVVEILTMGYAGALQEASLAAALLTGTYAWLYWLAAAFLLAAALISGIQALAGRYAQWLIVLSAVLVNGGALTKRYLLVVPSLTQGRFLPYGPGIYAPTWVEYAVVVGLLALAALLFVIFMKVFPILEVPEES